MSGNGIGRGRSRGLLVQKFENKNISIPSAESIEDKSVSKYDVAPPGTSTSKTAESSSVSSGDSKGNIKSHDSDIENKARKPMGIGRGRGSSLQSSFNSSNRSESKATENTESSSEKKPFVGRGRGLNTRKTVTTTSTESEVSNSMKDLKITESSEKDEKAKYEDGDKATSKFRRREKPTMVKTGNETRNEVSPSLSLSANYVKIKTTEPHIYQYSISFAPKIESRLMRIKIIQTLPEADIGCVKEARAFDGMNLFLSKKLPTDETIIHAIKPTDKTPIDIMVKFTNNVSFNECPMVYNVIFKRIENALRMVKIGRDYFYPEKKIVLPQRRMEIWPGYVTAIQNFDGGLLLQCDVSHKVIRNDSCYDIIQEINKTSNSRDQMRNECSRQLLGQIILTPHNNRNYRISDIDWNKNCLSEFECNGSPINYRDYFKNTYGLQISDLEQPLIVSKAKTKSRIPGQESGENLIYLIPELCMLTGLTDDMVKDFRLMRDLHDHCRVTPKKRHEGLLQFVDNIHNCKEAMDLLRHWNIRIDRETIDINACKINPEDILFGQDAKVSAGPNADFKQALGQNKVMVGIRIENWILITPRSQSQKAQSLSQALQQKGPKVGVYFKPPRVIEMQGDRTDDYVRELKRNIEKGLQLVVTVMSAAREDRYNAIKKLCYVDSPVPSQCVLGHTLKEGPKLNSVAINIALQINAKLGGELWAVKIPIKKFMCVGLDCWHDSASRYKKGGGRSVGAVVGSTNPLCTRWYSRSAFQRPHQEIVDVLQSCMISLLKAYFEENNFLPETIFMYRDGVSDGQLGLVQRTEIEQFLKAFDTFRAGYKPALVYNIVQKRINTRLYVPDKRNAGEIMNPNPGTVVDHTVTKANLYDFYLVSQSVRQGTVTPTHYIILYDNSKYTPHQVQLMAYKTCHIYYNWPGTVRVPAPCMYAHKLAYMVGQNLKIDPSSVMSDRLYYL